METEKVYIIRGIDRHTGLTETIRIVARTVEEAMLRAATTADNLRLERCEGNVKRLGSV